MADHVHLWTSFDASDRRDGQPVRSCVVCEAVQTWDDAFINPEPGIWWNHDTQRFDDAPFGWSYRRRLTAKGWDCERHGHLLTFGKPLCVVCNEYAVLGT